MARRPTVYVCRAGDCRSAGRKRQALVDEVVDVADVVEVRCQSICNGPVAGVELDGRVEWFERLGKKKARRAFARVVARRPGVAQLPARLRTRRVAKRAGRLRGR